MFIPDPRCPPRSYRQFETLDKAIHYLNVHNNTYGPMLSKAKCSILEKGTDRVVKVHKFR
jgi:hypothetical protein